MAHIQGTFGETQWNKQLIFFFDEHEKQLDEKKR